MSAPEDGVWAEFDSLTRDSTIALTVTSLEKGCKVMRVTVKESRSASDLTLRKDFTLEEACVLALNVRELVAESLGKTRVTGSDICGACGSFCIAEKLDSMGFCPRCRELIGKVMENGSDRYENGGIDMTEGDE